MFYNDAKKQAIKLLENRQAEYKSLGNQAIIMHLDFMILENLQFMQ